MWRWFTSTSSAVLGVVCCQALLLIRVFYICFMIWKFQIILLYSLDFLEFNLNILITVDVTRVILLTASKHDFSLTLCTATIIIPSLGCFLQMTSSWYIIKAMQEKKLFSRRKLWPTFRVWARYNLKKPNLSRVQIQLIWPFFPQEHPDFLAMKPFGLLL